MKASIFTSPASSSRPTAFTEVRAHLAAVTNEMYAVLKSRISRNLDEQERKVRETNAPPAIPGPKQSTPGR